MAGVPAIGDLLRKDRALVAAGVAAMMVLAVHLHVRAALRRALPASPDAASAALYRPRYGWIFLGMFAATYALMHLASGGAGAPAGKAGGGGGKAGGGGRALEGGGGGGGGGGAGEGAAAAGGEPQLVSLDDVMRYIDRAEPTF